jgi:hypothetical protein
VGAGVAGGAVVGAGVGAGVGTAAVVDDPVELGPGEGLAACT